MIRGWSIKGDNSFEFNSEDTSGHPWGDFVMNFGKGFKLKIDGNSFVLPSGNYSWLFFHRDEDGIIDHLVPVKKPEERDFCPICNPIRF